VAGCRIDPKIVRKVYRRHQRQAFSFHQEEPSSINWRLGVDHWQLTSVAGKKHKTIQVCKITNYHFVIISGSDRSLA
jgi:hypothetical protein